jgi:putative SOS response-associated peptidase YedK
VCGRYTMATPDLGRVRSRFGLDERVELRRRFNVAPTDDVAAVTTDREGRPRGDVLRWGLVPFWAEDPRIGSRMINARAESVTEKSAFRDAFASRRCLILADGFY